MIRHIEIEIRPIKHPQCNHFIFRELYTIVTKNGQVWYNERTPPDTKKSKSLVRAVLDYAIPLLAGIEFISNSFGVKSAVIDNPSFWWALFQFFGAVILTTTFIVGLVRLWKWNIEYGKELGCDLALFSYSSSKLSGKDDLNIRFKGHHYDPDSNASQFKFYQGKFSKWFPAGMDKSECAQKAMDYSYILKGYGYIKGRWIIRNEKRSKKTKNNLKNT